MFAVGLWNESERRLVLARDRMGIKPLYFARRGAELYFGSELKTILIHPEIRAQSEPAGLDCWLSLELCSGPVDADRGYRETAARTLAGMAVRQVRSSGILAAAVRSSGTEIPAGEAKDQLDGLLESAVGEHMLSDVPLGLWLSGGIDSSTILHYAAAQSSAPLRTFSISFQGRSFDETDYIARLVSQYGTRHDQLDLSTDLRSARRDRTICRLRRRAEWGRRRFAGVVPLADDAPYGDGGAER